MLLQVRDRCGRFFQLILSIWSVSLSLEADSTLDSKRRKLVNTPDSRCPILLLFAHPALEKSRVNLALLDAAQRVDGVTVHDLYELYPDFHIDVEREQGLLLNHEIVIFQHPLFWYSTPSILKEWQDLVLEHGWAYGSEGAALAGRRLVSVISTGGSEEAYQEGGYNRFTIRQLMAPIEQTAHLCSMAYGPAFVVHGTHLMKLETIERHAKEYGRFLAAASSGRIDWKMAERFGRLNEDLDAIISEEVRHAR